MIVLMMMVPTASRNSAILVTRASHAMPWKQHLFDLGRCITAVLLNKLNDSYFFFLFKFYVRMQQLDYDRPPIKYKISLRTGRSLHAQFCNSKFLKTTSYDYVSTLTISQKNFLKNLRTCIVKLKSNS